MNELRWPDVHGKRPPLVMPDGTQLRTQAKGRDVLAYVHNGKARYAGRDFDSMNALGLGIFGRAEDAWRVFWIRRPGDADWFHAEWYRLDDKGRAAHEMKVTIQRAKQAEQVSVSFDSELYRAMCALGRGNPEGVIEHVCWDFVERVTEGER